MMLSLFSSALFAFLAGFIVVSSHYLLALAVLSPDELYDSPLARSIRASRGVEAKDETLPERLQQLAEQLGSPSERARRRGKRGKGSASTSRTGGSGGGGSGGGGGGGGGSGGGGGGSGGSGGSGVLDGLTHEMKSLVEKLEQVRSPDVAYKMRQDAAPFLAALFLTATTSSGKLSSLTRIVSIHHTPSFPPARPAREALARAAPQPLVELPRSSQRSTRLVRRSQNQNG